MIMYDTSEFCEWLNPFPENLANGDLYLDEELGNSDVRRGLRPDAPPEAVKAFAEYIEVLRWAKRNGIKF